MAEIVLRSRKLTRDELARVFKTPRMIKAFEDLYQDLIETLPDAIEGSDGAAEEALSAALLAHGTAAAAQGAADQLHQLIAQIEAILLTARDESARLQRIEQRLNEIESQLRTQPAPNTTNLQRQIDELRVLTLGS